MRNLLVIAIIAFAPPATARDFTIDGHLIDRCLAINDETPMRCVGRQADACVDRNDGGPNMVVSACLENELAFWDAFLNRTYARVLDRAHAEQSMDIGYAPDQLTNAVRSMQRSWLSYRDATCDHELARAMPFGSAAGPAINRCLMRETARQVFQLIDIERSYRQ